MKERPCRVAAPEFIWGILRCGDLNRQAEACPTGWLVCCGGLAEVAHWVDRSAIDANFVVDVRASGTSADADVADGIASAELLADQNVQG